MSVSSALLALTALIVIAAIAGAVWRVRDGRLRAGAGAMDVSDLGVAVGRISLVQFSTETCSRCPQVRRMLQDVAATRPDVDHVDVDLTDRPDLASRHRVLSTPTTFLIGAEGQLLARFIGAPRRGDVEAALAGPVLQETA